jgi:hypothetical protein
MTIEEVYNKMTNCQLRQILDYSYSVNNSDINIIDDYDNPTDSNFSSVTYIRDGFLYHSNDFVTYEAIFDAREFKSYIRERRINGILE